MHNVTHTVDGDKLIITVDIGKGSINAAPPSSTGKTNIVGTTGGYQPIPSANGSSVQFALTVIAKKGRV